MISPASFSTNRFTFGLSKKLTLSIAISTALSLSACVSNNDNGYQSKDVINVINVPTAWSVETVSTLPNPADWLKNFGDEQLIALINEGKKNNIDLKIAAANMQKAWLLAKKSGVALQPNLDLSVNRGQTGSVEGGSSSSSINVGLQVGWELDVWGRIQSSIDAAQAQSETAQADYLFAEHSLSANIAKSYFKVIEAKQQAQLTQDNITILQKILRITDVKYKNGLLTGQDLALNKANLASASEQLVATEGAKRDAIRALELLLGRYPNASLDISDVLPELPAPLPAGLPSSILERRPDMIAAERQVAAAFFATKQAKTAQLPSFSLSGSLGGASDSLSNVLSPSNVAWQLGSNILAPLFDGGRRQIDLEIANVEQQQALDNYRKKALSAFAEVEQSLDNSLNLTKRFKALELAYQENEKALKISTIRYQEGESELINTLQIQQQTMSTKSSLITIKRNQLEQQINLYLALGGSW